jgi:hypothetical protein
MAALRWGFKSDGSLKIWHLCVDGGVTQGIQPSDGLLKIWHLYFDGGAVLGGNRVIVC